MTWEWRRGHGCGGGFARGIRAIAEGVGRDTDRRFARGLAHPPEAALSRLRRTVKVSGELAGYGGFPGLAPVVMARREAGRLSEGRTAGSVQ